MCEFQDKKTGKMIGVAKVRNGLYILDGENNCSIRRQQQHVAYSSSSQSTSNLSSIWLQHFRLGHPPFRLLKQLFPDLFNSLDPSSLRCDECIIAKHHWVSFPINNILSSKPFYLIHSNVWGPSWIPNYSGPKWFITFIDDCTQMCWVFLLKDKTTIRSVLITFCKMIQTQFGTTIKRLIIDNAKDYFNTHLQNYFQ